MKEENVFYKIQYFKNIVLQKVTFYMFCDTLFLGYFLLKSIKETTKKQNISINGFDII